LLTGPFIPFVLANAGLGILNTDTLNEIYSNNFLIDSFTKELNVVSDSDMPQMNPVRGLLYLMFLPSKRCCRVENRAIGFAWLFLFVALITSTSNVYADVPQGSPQSATNYYEALSQKLNFSTPDQIFQTKLDDVATYFGYDGFTGQDLQNKPSDLLMLPNLLLELAKSPAGSLLFDQPDRIVSMLVTNSFDYGDILVTRFFAPKIININLPETSRPLGWRKLVRFRARPGSLAQANHIQYGIILFNIFTKPGEQPFVSETNQSVNTQVILVPEADHFSKPNDTTGTNYDTVYWLDYDTLASGGKLSFALNASFDASELPQTNNGVRPYFVPEGCVACHGNNKRASMVNYLDTDHWFDRIENDFTAFKTNGLSLLVDAGTSDTNSSSYKRAFDVITMFNKEADEQVSSAQPKHDEALASHKWLELHGTNNNYSHVLPADRGIGIEPRWSTANSNDAPTLDVFNQYCFRCHGTVKFSVFNRQEIRQPQILAMIEQVIKTNASVGVKMPPDRPLPDNVRQQFIDFINQ